MISLTILSPAGVLCSVQVSKVSFPGSAGAFTVYPEHAPLISSLLPGDISWTGADGSTGSVRIRTGCVRVLRDNIEACVEVAGGSK